MYCQSGYNLMLKLRSQNGWTPDKKRELHDIWVAHIMPICELEWQKYIRTMGYYDSPKKLFTLGINNNFNMDNMLHIDEQYNGESYQWYINEDLLRQSLSVLHANKYGENDLNSESQIDSEIYQIQIILQSAVDHYTDTELLNSFNLQKGGRK